MPLLRLAITRTASIGSRVPPAVTTTCSPAERTTAEHPFDFGDDPLGRRQATLAGVAAGQPALVGFDDVHAAAAQAWRCCRRPPGAPTSRCASPGRRSTGARVASRTLVNRSVDSPAAYAPISRAVAGHDEHEISRLAELGVRDRRCLVPQAGLHGLAGQRRQRGDAEEVLGALCHHRDDVSAGVDQPTADLDGLVGSDSSGDTEDDALAGEHGESWR